MSFPGEGGPQPAEDQGHDVHGPVRRAGRLSGVTRRGEQIGSLGTQAAQSARAAGQMAGQGARVAGRGVRAAGRGVQAVSRRTRPDDPARSADGPPLRASGPDGMAGGWTGGPSPGDAAYGREQDWPAAYGREQDGRGRAARGAQAVFSRGAVSSRGARAASRTASRGAQVAGQGARVAGRGARVVGRGAQVVGRGAQVAGRGAQAAGRGARWTASRLADQVLATAPRLPVRSQATLREQFPGRSPDEIAQALIDGSARMAAAVGAAAGTWAVVPFLPGYPAEVAAETLAVVGIEIKLIAELHEVYGLRVPGPTVSRMSAYVAGWADRRGVVVAPAGVVFALGSPLRRRLQRRLAARVGQSTIALGPLMTGATAAALINRRETKRLGQQIRDDLRARSPHPYAWPL